MARLVSHPSSIGRQAASLRAGQGELMARQAPFVRDISRSTAKSALLRLPHEMEDTQLTGGTRSLVRRLMALNVTGTLRKDARQEASLPTSKIA